MGSWPALAEPCPDPQKEIQMARNLVSIPVAFTFKDWTVGTVLDGTYLGFRNVKAPFGSARQHDFHTESGESFAVWDTVVLADALAQVEEGDRVIVRYDGDRPATKAGHSPMHLFTVEVDRATETSSPAMLDAVLS